MIDCNINLWQQRWPHFPVPSLLLGGVWHCQFWRHEWDQQTPLGDSRRQPVVTPETYCYLDTTCCHYSNPDVLLSLFLPRCLETTCCEWYQQERGGSIISCLRLRVSSHRESGVFRSHIPHTQAKTTISWHNKKQFSSKADILDIYNQSVPQYMRSNQSRHFSHNAGPDCKHFIWMRMLDYLDLFCTSLTIQIQVSCSYCNQV